MVFLLGRKLLDDVAGIVAAIVFAFLSLSPAVRGLSGHATHFVAFFALAGAVVLVRAVSSVQCSVFSVQYSEAAARPRPFTINSQLPNFQLFLAGLLFGVAFLMKQHGVFFGLFGGAYLLWTRVTAVHSPKSKVQSPESRVQSR